MLLSVFGCLNHRLPIDVRGYFGRFLISWFFHYQISSKVPFGLLTSFLLIFQGFLGAATERSLVRTRRGEHPLSSSVGRIEYEKMCQKFSIWGSDRMYLKYFGTQMQTNTGSLQIALGYKVIHFIFTRLNKELHSCSFIPGFEGRKSPFWSFSSSTRG